MKNRPVFYSIAGIAAALVLLNGTVSLYQVHESLSEPLDLSSVSNIRVSGTASDIRISAGTDGALTAQFLGERRGWGATWNSSWFSDACPARGSMRVEGDTLTVNVDGGGRVFDWSDCAMTLTANLPAGSAVRIDQQATRTELSGDFLLIDVKSDAGDVSFAGHAQTVSVSGTALRARLAFDTVTHDETIAISGKMLDARVSFLEPTEVSYSVEAKASYVDSSLPNTPGAMPAISIRGEMAHVRID